MIKLFLIALALGSPVFTQASECSIIVEIVGGTEAQRLEASLLINRAIEVEDLGEFVSITSGTLGLHVNSSIQKNVTYLEQLKMVENVSLQTTEGYAHVLATLPKLEIIFAFENAVDRYFGHDKAARTIKTLSETGKLSPDYLNAPQAKVKNLGYCQ